MKIEGMALTLDDLTLRPRHSSIRSRFSGEIDLSVELMPNIKLKYPIIASNMDTISGPELVQEINRLGGTGIVHRFMDAQPHREALKSIEGWRIGCIGVGEGGQVRMEAIAEFCDAVLIEVAHGHSDAVLKQIEWIKSNYDIPIIAGNVATYEGARDLASAGVHSIKSGVGQGSVCSTRVRTGNGVPLATTILECREAIDDWYEELEEPYKWKPTLIADGGIRNSGDIIKCLALGADTIITGSLFAGVEEAPGKPISTAQGQMKIYRGMASRAAQEDWKGSATSIEGEMSLVPYKGPLENVFNDLVSGMLSGMSYQNAHNLKELYENAVFHQQTTSGLREAMPHGLLK